MLVWCTTVRQERVAHYPPDYPEHDPLAPPSDELVHDSGEGEPHDEQHPTPPRQYACAHGHSSQEYRADEYCQSAYDANSEESFASYPYGNGTDHDYERVADEGYRGACRSQSPVAPPPLKGMKTRYRNERERESHEEV